MVQCLEDHVDVDVGEEVVRAGGGVVAVGGLEHQTGSEVPSVCSSYVPRNQIVHRPSGRFGRSSRWTLSRFPIVGDSGDMTRPRVAIALAFMHLRVSVAWRMVVTMAG